VNAKKQATVRRAAAITGALALVGFITAAPAVGDDTSGPVKVINTETVKVYMGADGDVQSKRFYEQLAMFGHGSVDVKNPVSTDGLRNLDGFGGFDVSGEDTVTKTTVDGTKRYRSVSTFDKALPVEITPSYKLNGKKVGPHGIVGKSGKLEVTYKVVNKTATAQEISIPDGSGGTVTKMVQVPVPMVGSLTTTLPKTFTNVEPNGANTAGDGAGGLTLSYTMTLFPPLGSDTATLHYTANITDGVVPETSVTLLPVDPLASPTFKTAADSYQGGASTGAELLSGATTIDTNLLKLRDGASSLLAGLIQLRDGANQLNSGLVNDAAPGAKKLADGAEQLDDGLVRLRNGAVDLSAGAKKARAGSLALDAGAQKLAAGLKSAQAKAPALITGLSDVRDGLVLVNGGLTQMYDQIGGIPTQAEPLFDGIQQLIDGIGNAATPDTLLYGVNAVRQGLTDALPQIQTMADGVYKNSTTDPGAYQKLSCAISTLTYLKDGFAGGATACGALPPLAGLGVTDSAVLTSILSGLTDGRDALATSAGDVNQTTLYGGLLTLKAQLSHIPTSAADTPGAIAALAAVQCGLDNQSVNNISLPGGVPAVALCKTVSGDRAPGLKQGLQQLSGGINQLIDGVIAAVRGGIGELTDVPADNTLRGGVNGLIGGIDLLGAGGSTLVDGLGQLADGSQQLAAGTGDLSSGLGDLSAGANKLAAGAGDAQDGGSQVADGANKLSDGLGAAADGSGQLADGLSTAADGAPQLVDGAQRLSTEGMGALKKAGKDTALNYGEMYAVIKAGSERAHTHSMAYGAPAGAEGLTAYSFTIKGEDGEDTRNLTRALAGLVLLGLGGGAFALRRRAI
jgi:putative membrane protein